mmetsp:Transcript_11773/g.26428  ORF Transcript_11773/g.26428 Transcript_11773/m.26428 type:complete len:203 (+) Transcript_11773:70-678(+)|eukprot:CAMPEP_0180133802 /NCGR_PEP_ID=MMETSP0986-20121125/9755_1 /TAXON_ID=697907 /ORGANISM="non described non described, Strain CCMP2293" /LENGTH=202 /DNA_ID=CAMNT_0022073985 /DNA_START=49 /DNA_END=657 /DNA_ORIENTATION=-
MGRSSGKQNKFSGGGGGGAPGPDEGGMKHSAHFEAEEIRILLEQKPRMSWEEYKEKHKDQLSDKMGMGIEREQAEYRKQLDEERELRLARGVNKGKDGKDGKGAKKDKKDKKDKSDKKEKKKFKKEKKKLKKEAKKARKSEGGGEEGEAGKKRSRDDSSSSSSDSDDEPEKEKKKKKEKKESGSEEEGPVRLSDFHKGHYDD